MGKKRGRKKPQTVTMPRSKEDEFFAPTKVSVKKWYRIDPRQQVGNRRKERPKTLGRGSSRKFKHNGRRGW